jgi:transcriptional regulator with XRE-family HTH domain
MSEDELDQLQSAVLHHVVAGFVRKSMTGTQEELAVTTGMTASRLGRILRGDIVLRVEDIMKFRRKLHISLTAIDAMFTRIDASKARLDPQLVGLRHELEITVEGFGRLDACRVHQRH